MMEALSSVVFILLLIFLYWIEAGLSDQILKDAISIYNEGTKYHTQSPDLAIDYYRRSLDLLPRLPQAHMNLAFLYKGKGSMEKSLYHYKEASRYAPDNEFNATTICNIIDLESSLYGLSHIQHLDHWIETVEEYLSQKHNSSRLITKLGQLYFLKGHFVHSKLLFERSIAVDPNYSLPWIEVGNWYFQRYELIKAREFYFVALQLEQSESYSSGVMYNLFAINNNLAQSFREEGRLKDALHYITLSSQYASNFTEQVIVSSILVLKLMALDWKNLEDVENKFHVFSMKNIEVNAKNPDARPISDRDHSLDPHTALLVRYSTAEEDRSAGYRKCLDYPGYAQHQMLLHSSSDEAKHYYQYLIQNKTADVADQSIYKLRVGYLSFDWRHHPMGYLTSHFVLNHSADIESYCISYGHDDQSEIRKLITSHCQYFVETTFNRNDYEVAAFIFANLKLDILIDLTTHTYNGRLSISNYRPASIVVNYLGYPGTTGCDKSFDYVILDRHVAPANLFLSKVYSEKVVYMPYCYQANNMPLDIAPFLFPSHHSEAYGSMKILYRRYGRKNICSINSVKKIEPLSFHTWMNILHVHPDYDLMFLDIPDDSKSNIFYHASYHGIDKSRIQFIAKLPWRSHLFRIALQCDAVLDTFVYNAHTTATDVLWMSLPLFSLRSFGIEGNRMPSRVAGSIIYHSLSHPHIQTILPYASNLLLSDAVKEYEDRLGEFDAIPNSIDIIQKLLYKSSCIAPSMNRIKHREHFVRSQEAMLDLYLIQHNNTLGSRFTRDGRKFHIIMLQNHGLEEGINICSHMLTALFNTIQSQSNSSFIDLRRYLEFFQRSPPSSRAIISLIHRYLALTPYGSNNGVVDSSTLSCLTQFASTSSVEYTDDRSFINISRPVVLYNYTDNTNNLYNDLAYFLLYNAVPEISSDDSDVERRASLYRLYSNFTYSLYQALTLGFSQTTLYAITFIDIIKHNTNNMKTQQINTLTDKFTLYFIQTILQIKHANLIEDIQGVYTSPSCNDNVSYYVEEDYELMDFYQLSSFIYSKLLVCHVATLLSFALSSIPSIKSPYPSPLTVVQYYHSYIVHLLFLFRSPSSSPYSSEDFLKLTGLFYSLSDIGVANFPTHLSTSFPPSMQPLSTHLSAIYQIFVAFLTSLLTNRGQYLNAKELLLLRRMSFIFSVNVNLPQREGGWTGVEYNFILFSLTARLELHGLKHTHSSLYNGIAPKYTPKSIAIYCFEYENAWWPGWGPKLFLAQLNPSNHSSTKGMGGSEEAVAYLAHALASLGYGVTIYAEISVGENNMTTVLYPNQTGIVRWLHYSLYPSLHKGIVYDAFIAWRYPCSLFLGSRTARNRYLWLHDRLDFVVFSFFTMFNVTKAVLVQSESHREHTAEKIALGAAYHLVNSSLYADVLDKSRNKVKILQNGVYIEEGKDATEEELVLKVRREYGGPRYLARPSSNSSSINPSQRKHLRFIYASSPMRGLESLLILWPRITAAFPTAELHVYYGFTNALREQLSRTMGETEYNAFEHRMRQRMNHSNIFYHGAVSHFELAEGYKRAGFLLYPATFAETGCITVMKSMVHGAIPITSRLVDSVLEHLGHGFDLGPGGRAEHNYKKSLGYESYLSNRTLAFTSLTTDVQLNDTRLKDWLDSEYLSNLLQIIRVDIKIIEQHRREMVKYATQHFSWLASARRLQDIMNTD